MYSYVRQHLDYNADRTLSFSEPKNGGELYTTYKCKIQLDHLQFVADAARSLRSSGKLTGG